MLRTALAGRFLQEPGVENSGGARGGQDAHFFTAGRRHSRSEAPPPQPEVVTAPPTQPPDSPNAGGLTVAYDGVAAQRFGVRFDLLTDLGPPGVSGFRFVWRNKKES